MEFPNRKLSDVEALAFHVSYRPISTRRTEVDPDKPHPWAPASMWGECLDCGGSDSNPIHAEPLGGWPE